MRSRSMAALAAFAFLAFVGVSACVADDPSIVRVKDVTYASPGGTPLKLDVARPPGEGPFPAVLAIHGGGWRAGSKGDVAGLMDQLVHHGYVAVGPQYRFCPEFPFPAQVHDAKAALRWVKTHAAEYHVDPDRVGVIGFSAGGHLALMLGLTDAKDGLEGAGHGWAGAEMDRTLAETYAFFDQHLKPKPALKPVP